MPVIIAHRRKSNRLASLAFLIRCVREIQGSLLKERIRNTITRNINVVCTCTVRRFDIFSTLELNSKVTSINEPTRMNVVPSKMRGFLILANEVDNPINTSSRPQIAPSRISISAMLYTFCGVVVSSSPIRLWLKIMVAMLVMIATTTTEKL